MFSKWPHLGFPFGAILATFDLQIASTLPSKFESVSLSFQKKKRKIDFQMAAMEAIFDFKSEQF